MNLPLAFLPEVADALASRSIPAFEIGRLTPAEQGLKLVTPQGEVEWPAFDRDELARFFSSVER